jgi:hypothetical protein
MTTKINFSVNLTVMPLTALKRGTPPLGREVRRGFLTSVLIRLSND